jgi:hypothetical protein
MKFKGLFFRVAGCAVTLLGLSTIASANITGTGCVVSGNSGQTAPLSVGAFTALCTGATVVSGGEYTFTAPDTLGLSAAETINTGTGLVSGPGGLGGTITGGFAAANFGPASSGSAGGGGNSTVWDLHEINIAAGTYTFNIQHDDGIFVASAAGNTTVAGACALASAAGPTSSETSACTVTVTSNGGALDLFYDECCGLPAVLQATMPAEVPEPASMLLLGTLLAGSSAVWRRRMKKG